METPAVPIETISFLAGLILPPIVEFVKIKILPDSAKRWLAYVIALGSSILVGVLVALITGQEISVESVIYVVVAAEVAYNLVWKNFQLDDRMEAALSK